MTIWFINDVKKKSWIVDFTQDGVVPHDLVNIWDRDRDWKIEVIPSLDRHSKSSYKHDKTKLRLLTYIHFPNYVNYVSVHSTPIFYNR